MKHHQRFVLRTDGDLSSYLLRFFSCVLILSPHRCPSEPSSLLIPISNPLPPFSFPSPSARAAVEARAVAAAAWARRRGLSSASSGCGGVSREAATSLPRAVSVVALSVSPLLRHLLCSWIPPPPHPSIHSPSRASPLLKFCAIHPAPRGWSDVGMDGVREGCGWICNGEPGGCTGEASICLPRSGAASRGAASPVFFRARWRHTDDWFWWMEIGDGPSRWFWFPSTLHVPLWLVLTDGSHL